MADKRNIGIFYGGKSTEHEVSIRSARNIVEAIDKAQFNAVLIGVDKSGRWHLQTVDQLMTVDELPVDYNSKSTLTLFPGNKQNQLASENGESIHLDVAFPIIHGTGGEDGTIQGVFKWLNIPFVGCGVMAASVSLDKEVTKRLLNEAGIKNSKFLSYHKSERNTISFQKVKETLGLPIYIKPPNLGSSVGISKVEDESAFESAIDLALQFDYKVMIEENIVGREIECAVLGNAFPKASAVGEVVTSTDNHSFYSYDAKYVDADGSKTIIPALIDQSIQDKIREIAIDTYTCLCCEGLSRVDVFVTDNHEIIVNEVNSLPGFTDISMYPKLWEAVGISYASLITQLIDLAISRFQDEQNIITSI